MKAIQRLAAVGAMAVLATVPAACAHSRGSAGGGHASAPNPEAHSPEAHSPEALAPGGEATATSGTGVTKITDIFGPGCGGLPTTGKGSPRGMVDDPVATAASHNPLLKTLAKTLTAANLDDILNSVPTLTVFAPDDPAFQQWDAAHPGIITQLITAPDVVSPNSELAKILTYHVVGQRYDAAGLVQAGTVDTLEGAKITIGGTSAAPTVNGMPVVCGNIPTKNATVFVIGQVLPVPAF